MGKFDGLRQWNGDFAEWEAAMAGCSTSDFAELLGCTPRRIQGLRNPAATQRASLSRADRIAMQAAAEYWGVKMLREIMAGHCECFGLTISEMFECAALCLQVDSDGLESLMRDISGEDDGARRRDRIRGGVLTTLVRRHPEIIDEVESITCEVAEYLYGQHQPRRCPPV